MIFPMAVSKIPWKKQKDLLAQFEKSDKGKITAARIESFHQILENMERVYLK